MKGIIHFVVMLIVFLCSQVTVFSQTGEPVDLSQPRIWTATTGHKLAAVYAGREGNNIRLKLQDGEVRAIAFDKLSDADQQLLNNQTQKRDGIGSTTLPNKGESGRSHPFVKFLTEAKQKRLNSEEGVEYYQNVIAELYKQIQEYSFQYPEDIVKEDNSFNMKYLHKIESKMKPVSERRNLFTGEYMATPVYVNEPQWEKVLQEVHYTLNNNCVVISQKDTLYAGKSEKIITFVAWFSRKTQQEAKYVAWYTEESKNYMYSMRTWVEPSNTGVLTLGGIRGDDFAWLCCYDIRKGIYYTLNILVDQNGQITIRNSEEGAIQFFATQAGKKKGFTYPRNFDYWTVEESRRVILGRYDLNGNPTSPEHLWPSKKGATAESKPSVKHDDPLNVFAERNIKDK